MPPKKVHCQVRGCRQRSKGIDLASLTFHRFPLEVNEASQWVQFSGSEYAQDEFKRLGPIGVRKLWMCSLHFEPNCYKMLGSKANLRHGAIPTLSGPTDEPEADEDEEGSAETGGTAAEESDDPGEGISTVAGAELTKTAPKRKREHLDDRFYDFLKDNDDSDNTQRFTSKSRKPHPPFCVCSSCRSDRAARAMEKGASPHKAIQTADIGPQPDASPVPLGGSQDSCRLCFSTDQLEPLCSGMIVVRDEMLDKIYVCTGVLIIPRPKVSIFICTPCAQLINSFHAYRQQVCSNNQALLRTIALKASKASTTTSTPRIQKVSPLPQVRKPPPAPIRRKPPVGLIPIIDTMPSLQRAPTTLTQYVKIAPKLPMVVEPEVTVVQPVKDELDDPLEGCGETSQRIAAPTTAPPLIPANKSNVLIKLQSKQTIAAMTKEPPKVPMETIEIDDDAEDLPDGERWSCWHCDNAFPFQFECAKHLLQVHGENVGSIKKRLKLDELNANMLHMMSMNQKK
ncbi:uncharacterized protein LOC109425367 [Aedes albopictus]|uniref:THAP-type domain-containing protein n=1 Tax=Aedes albopictus TaxID=7160 RepID=A0ABM1ZZ12_AEDAL